MCRWYWIFMAPILNIYGLHISQGWPRSPFCSCHSPRALFNTLTPWILIIQRSSQATYGGCFSGFVHSLSQPNPKLRLVDWALIGWWLCKDLGCYQDSIKKGDIVSVIIWWFMVESQIFYTICFTSCNEKQVMQSDSKDESWCYLPVLYFTCDILSGDFAHLESHTLDSIPLLLAMWRLSAGCPLHFEWTSILGQWTRSNCIWDWQT